MPARTAALIAAVLLAACASPTLPDRPASDEGVIYKRDVQASISDGQPTIWVKTDTTDQQECGIIYVIGHDTDLAERMPDGSVRARHVADLQVGRRVQVWTQVVLTSCPGQASAEAVQLLPD